MKDARGLYYYPFPDNKRIRMYVRKTAGRFWFRLWDADDSSLWETHGWVPSDAVEAAADLYTGGVFNPRTAYDTRIAEALVANDTAE